MSLSARVAGPPNHHDDKVDSDVHHVVRLGRKREVQRDDIALCQEPVQRDVLQPLLSEGRCKATWKRVDGCGLRVYSSPCYRKVDVRLPGKRNLNSHGARPVYLFSV